MHIGAAVQRVRLAVLSRSMVSSNTLTNIKMTNAIKGLVSKKKKRYKADGFNLDLSCKHCDDSPVESLITIRPPSL